MSTDAPKPAPAKPDASTPPWGDDFDPARAWATITRQREAEQGLKARIAELETAAEGLVPKAELDAALTRADAAETTLKTSKRAAALAKADLPEELHAFVTAEDDDGMAEQIAKLAAAVKPGASAASAVTAARPSAELTPGHGGDEAPSFNADALASSIHGKGRA